MSLIILIIMKLKSRNKHQGEKYSIMNKVRKFKQMCSKFLNKRITRKAATLLSAATLAIGGIFGIGSSPAMTTAYAADNAAGRFTYKFSDIALTLTVTEDLVGFTQNMTSNNSYLDKIGADDVEEVRAALQMNNIYLELIPKEGDINYEILVSGKNAPSGASNFDSISNETLNEYFNDYIAESESRKSDTSVITETIDASSIETINGVNYFCTEVTSVSGNAVTVHVKKLYTIMQDKAITYTLQTTQPSITDDMSTMLTDIISTAEYSPVKGSILENAFFVEIMTSLVSMLVFVGILALILYLMIRAGKRKKRK